MRKAAAVIRVERQLLSPFDTHEIIWKRARVEFERKGIDLTRVTRIETSLGEPPFSEWRHWEIQIRIEYEEVK